MSTDARDDILNAAGVFDAARFNATVSSAFILAQTDPFQGLGRAVGAGRAIHALLGPSATIALANLPRAYEALSVFAAPNSALSALAAGIQFPGTLSSLASVGNIGIGANALHNTSINSTALGLNAASLANTIAVTPRFDYAAMGSLAPSYLASAASVFSLESSFARNIAGINDAITAMALPTYLNSLQTNVITMSSALQDTLEIINSRSDLLGTISIGALRSPAVEVYAAAHAAAAVSLPPAEQPSVDAEIEEILNDAADAFESRLASLQAELVVTYRGGLAAVEHGGPDWQRHSMVSFRELTTHALHLLAPDALITPSATPNDLHMGRPTRRARLNFIFSSVSNSTVAAFYEADMKAALALFDLLSNGTHRLGDNTTPDQVHYLRSRVVGLLTSILEARGY